MSHTVVCKQCGTKFRATRKSAIYCSTPCRVAAFRSVKDLCWYCGAIANSRDHVIPHSLTGDKVRQWTGVDIVECCVDCNSSLGSQLFDTMAERVEYLARRFFARHKLGANQPDWSLAEIAELTGTLRTYIIEAQRAWEIKKARHMHLTLRAAQLGDIEQS